MDSNIFKILILYIILITIILIIKPNIFYYDNKKTRIKPYDIFIYTQNPSDLITLHSVSIFIAILSYSVICNLDN